MADFESVHTMTDFYDGPRRGVADFKGAPHFYESTFGDVGDAPDEADDIFQLSPITDDAFQLALEDWAIWLRWQAANQRGETSNETHPALPIDRPRHDELQPMLDRLLKIDPNDLVNAIAEFRNNDSQLEVRWTVVPPVA